MQCVRSFTSSVSRLVSPLGSLPVLTVFVSPLLRAFRRFLALSLRKHTQQDLKPPSSPLQSPLSAIPVHPSAYADDSDFDPSNDEWASWLDQPFVQDACRTHLDNCLALDPAPHDHNP